ncbi:auxin-responsive protein SAUR50-like [Salvia hispanica]|uniref:auxin-responsive protein SAUR50-like n=1 Tax=Salvia hispanica TaxID=49212 RepID=UPI0020096E39|nr:auxin-responsive protein SAUR50-like [Salvia hispanica]
MSACSKIRHIVRIRQMLRRWRKKAAMAGRRPPCDVPAGHVAVSVGPTCKRFVIRATHLNHPILRKLLARAEEEFGFSNTGPLAIPCDESHFEEILCYLARHDPGAKSPARFTTSEEYCRVRCRSNLDITRPLLHG